MTIPILSVAFVVAAAVWCLVWWAAAVARDRGRTHLERRQDEIDAQAARLARRTLRDRVRAFAAKYGWQGSLAPLFMAAAVLYMVTAAVLAVVGIGPVLAGMLAFPFGFGVAAVTMSTLSGRRQRAFHAQLVAALDLFAGGLRSGAGAARAIEQVVPSLPEPLRSEMLDVVAQTRASRPLDEAMADVAARYPSRAMRLFVTALRCDKEKGGKIAEVLEEAADSVRKDFELQAEASAELAQEKAQFGGIVTFMVIVAVFFLTKGSDMQREALTSPIGLAVLGLGGANFVFGVFRCLRLFGRAKGEM